MTNRLLSVSLFFLVVLLLGLQIPILAHNYMAPYLYLSGIYPATDEPSNYPAATDNELAYLTELLKHKDGNIRAIAAGALGQTKSPKAVEPLLQALNDKNAYVQMNAALAFFHIEDQRSIEPLTRLLSKEGLASFGAAYGLTAQGKAGVSALMDSSPYGPTAEGIIMLKGKEAITWAIDALNGTNRKLDRAAVEILVHFRDGDTKSTVNEAVKDPKVVERLHNIVENATDESIELASALLQTPTDEEGVQEKRNEIDLQSHPEQDEGAGSDPLIKLDDATVNECAAEIRSVQDDSDEYQSLDADAAADLLARTSNPRGIKVLLNVLNERNAKAACIVARYLAFSNKPEALTALNKVLANLNHPAYKATVDALARSSNDAIMTKLLQSKDDYTVEQAILGLRYYSERPKLADHLIPMLKNPRHRHLAALVLAKYKDLAAIDTLVELLKTESQETNEVSDALGGYGAVAADKMLAFLSGSDAKARPIAARFFKCNSEPRAVDPLISALGDTDVTLRQWAIDALIFQNDPKAIPHYITALKDTDPTVRKRACFAIALHPDQTAIETLASLLTDKDKFTRTCAAIALGQLGDNRGADLIVSKLDQSTEGYSGGGEIPDITAIRAAGKLKEKRAASAIVALLPEDIRMSSFDGGGTEEELRLSRTTKLGALKSITGEDFGYAFYRWMAWSINEGNKPIQIFEPESPDYGEGYPEDGEE